MNRLQHESSPYLLQHADNPVDWYPFGDEAFAAAAARDVPILLSIGYSACHWCHVMAHESFEDKPTSEIMNDRFVCIKVDREEMPDVDQVYQQALALQGDHGGWPLTMFLTPRGSPFFGGTYFPPDDRFGRPSFRRLLLALSEAYRERRGQVEESSEQFRTALVRLGEEARSRHDGEEPTIAMLDTAAQALATRLDPVKGGFRGAPKFPNVTALDLILRRGSSPELVRTTLTKMAEGGIYDQIGGGFARYSTDEAWLVPHFEKMLYDNAQLLRLYAEGWQRFGDPLYARVVRETAAYLEREMRAPEGGFYTAQDADSEGVEGKYFVWTPQTLASAIGPARAALIARYFGVVEGGNWADPHGHGPSGASILHVVAQPESEAVRAELDGARAALLAARSRRVPPGTDDKCLASSNGLALAGLAEAGRIFSDPQMLDAARRTADFLMTHMTEASQGRLLRTFKRGSARLPGTLEDHAYVANGLLSLYEATFEPRYLEEAHRLTRLCLELFYDPQSLSFYMTAIHDEGLSALPVRPLSLHDSAVPSGMSRAVANLARLGTVCNEPSWTRIAEAVVRGQLARAAANPFGSAALLGAAELVIASVTEIVLVGKSTAALERAISRVYLPARMILHAASAPPLLATIVAGKTAHDGQPTAYVCRGSTCSPPISDPDALEAALKG